MLESETSYVSYDGSGSGPYAITFPYLDPDHIQVVIDSGSTSTTLTAGTDYTITDGSVITESNYPGTTQVVIRRVTSIVQPTELNEAGPFPASTLEASMDRLAMIAQETRRDASPIDVTGSGLVTQVPAVVFAVRSLEAASNSGLAVINGDGVANAPTIDTDFSTLPTVTTLADDDTVLVRASGTESRITLANLRPEVVNETVYYGSFFKLADYMVPDQDDGATIAAVDRGVGWEKVASYSQSAANIAYLRIVLPDDYNGGMVKMRLHQCTNTSATLDPPLAVVWQTRAAQATTGSGGLDISGTYVETTDGNHIGAYGYVQGAPIDLGSGWNANDPILIEIKRDPDHEDDTLTHPAQIVAVEFQYPSQYVTTPWT